MNKVNEMVNETIRSYGDIQKSELVGGTDSSGKVKEIILDLLLDDKIDLSIIENIIYRILCRLYPKSISTVELIMLKISKYLKNKQMLLDNYNSVSNKEINEFNYKCTHKDVNKNNNISLLDNNDGSNTCYICNQTFQLKIYNKEDIESQILSVNNIIQNIKTMYMDIQDETLDVCSSLLQMLNKLPDIYNDAKENFNLYDKPFQPMSGNLFNELNKRRD